MISLGWDPYIDGGFSSEIILKNFPHIKNVKRTPIVEIEDILT